MPIYDRTSRTRLLVLDFDVKHHGVLAVERDVRWAKTWAQLCGAAVLADRNTVGGGRHVIAVFAPGEFHTRDEVEPVLRALLPRLPTLDITPMLNSRTGSITPPGSATRDGGYRELDGELEEALSVLREGSTPGALQRMREYLMVDPARSAWSRETPASPARVLELPATLWEGVGDDARLGAQWRYSGAIAADVQAFAATGTRAPRRWLSRSEARFAVLCAAAVRGWSLAEVLARIDSGEWAGLGEAFGRYRRRTHAIREDWRRACEGFVTQAALVRSQPHGESGAHTPGSPPTPRRDSSGLRSKTHLVWLQHAYAWVHATWPGQAYRWTVLAVLDSLAYAALVTGKLAPDGTPTVAAGCRTLGSMAGLLDESTVAKVLRDLRDRPGSPVLLIRTHAGTDADGYSLVTARSPEDLDRTISPTPASRVRVRQVHDAWTGVLGLHLRYLYELVVDAGLNRADDVLAAAGLGRSAGHDGLAQLAQAGLITRGRGTVAPGPTTLDDIAARHALPERRRRVLARHRRERAQWRAWLALRHQIPADLGDLDTPAHPAAPWELDPALDEAMWALQMATGPPDRDEIVHQLSGAD